MYMQSSETEHFSWYFVTATSLNEDYHIISSMCFGELSRDATLGQ